MAKNNFGAGIVFDISGVDRTVSQLTKMGGAWGSLWGIMNVSGKFEQQLAGLGAVMKATSSQMQQLRETALTAGEVTQFSPLEAVQGLTELATAGQTAEEAMKTLIPVLDLSAASLGELKVPQAAQAIIGTLKAYRMGVGEASTVTDKLLRITQLTSLQTRDFAAALAKPASIAGGKNFRQPLNDTLITLGLMRNLNIDASSSGTALGEAIRRVGGMTLAQNALMKAGVPVFDKRTGKMRNMIEIMQDFGEKSKTMDQAEVNRIATIAFGARGMRVFDAIMGATFTTTRNGIDVTLQGSDAIEAMRAAMNDTTGTAQEFREKLLDTFEGQKTLLRGTMDTWSTVLGEPFTRILKPIVRFVNEGLLAAERAFRALPEPIKDVLAGIVLGAMALTTASAAWGTFSTFILPSLAAGFSAVLPAIGSFLLAAAPLAAIGYTLYQAWEQNLGGFRDTILSIGDAFKGVWAIASTWKDGTAELPVELADALDRAGIKDWVIGVGGWLGRMKGWVIEAGGVLAQWGQRAATLLVPPLEAMVRMGGSAAKVIGNIASRLGLWDNTPLEGTRKSMDGLHAVLAKVSNYIGKAATFLGGIFDNVSSWFNENQGKLTEWATDIWEALSGIAGEIWGVFRALGDAISPLFGDTISDVNMVKGTMDTLTQPVRLLKVALQGVNLVLRDIVGPSVTWLSEQMFKPLFKSIAHLIDGTRDNWKGFAFELVAMLIPVQVAWDKLKGSMGFDVDTRDEKARMLDMANQRGISTDYLLKHMGIKPEDLMSGGPKTEASPWQQQARNWSKDNSLLAMMAAPLKMPQKVISGETGKDLGMVLGAEKDLFGAWSSQFKSNLLGMFSDENNKVQHPVMSAGQSSLGPVSPEAEAPLEPVYSSYSGRGASEALSSSGSDEVDLVTADNTTATREQTGAAKDTTSTMGELRRSIDYLASVLGVLPDAIAQGASGGEKGMSVARGSAAMER